MNGAFYSIHTVQLLIMNSFWTPLVYKLLTNQNLEFKKTLTILTCNMDMDMEKAFGF